MDGKACVNTIVSAIHKVLGYSLETSKWLGHTCNHKIRCIIRVFSLNFHLIGSRRAVELECTPQVAHKLQQPYVKQSLQDIHVRPRKSWTKDSLRMLRVRYLVPDPKSTSRSHRQRLNWMSEKQRCTNESIEDFLSPGTVWCQNNSLPLELLYGWRSEGMGQDMSRHGNQDAGAAWWSRWGCVTGDAWQRNSIQHP